MTTPPFSFPFSHWTSSALTPSSRNDVTSSLILSSHLIVGLSSGEFCIYELSTSESGERSTYLLARLLGHTSSIVAIVPYTSASEVSPSEQFFLTLSHDGQLSKWELSDKRCVQCASKTMFPGVRTTGMTIVKWREVSLILVYGWACEVVVVNAQSLEMVAIWRGMPEWAFPVQKSVQEGSGLYTVTIGGKIHSWTIHDTKLERGDVVRFVKEGETVSLDINDQWGAVRGVKRAGEGYLVWQVGGLSLHVKDGEGFRKTKETEIGTAGIEVDDKTIMVKTEDHEIMILVLKGDSWEEVTQWRPSDELKDEMILGVSAVYDAEKNEGIMAVVSREKAWTADDGIDISIGSFTADRPEWSVKSLDNFRPRDYEKPSTCSEIFNNMLAVAHGTKINLYSTSAFLLNYHEPTASITLKSDESSICLLKRVRIKEYVATGGSHGSKGGKEYLVAGTKSGEISIIESPSYQCSKRLPLFTNPIESANLLPSNLGSRLRSTLLVSCGDAAAIVDVERARVMVNFPSHDHSRLISFATQPGLNIVALTYEDGTRKEWNMGQEDGGVLLNPPPSRGSAASQDGNDATDADWKTVKIGDLEDYEDNDVNCDGSIQLCDDFCRIGLPTAAINIRSILSALETAIDTASMRTRETERRVVGNHPAIMNAKSLLTALVPGGSLGAYLYIDDDADTGEELNELEELQFALDQFLFRRKQPGSLGQLGADRRITMLTPDALYGEEISPTLTSIRLLAILCLVSVLLKATGKENSVNTAVKRIIIGHLGRERVSLGVFAKFWTDTHPLIRETSRQCLDSFLRALTPAERSSVITYWAPYLPDAVAPELQKQKEVLRAVILLAKLLVDHPDPPFPDALKKSLGTSISSLLNDPTFECTYQTTAIEVLGYTWTALEHSVDCIRLIHRLILISISHSKRSQSKGSPVLARALLSIAEKNSPLLVTSLAANIYPPPSSTAGTDIFSMAATSSAAMAIAATIIQCSPNLFFPVLGILIEAVLKTLDPSFGLRERVLPAVTKLIEATVSAYETVAFHRPSQRLAFSPAVGVVCVYDLKTGQTAFVLDGHVGVATALSFNPEGKMVVGVDGAEVFVWRLGTGIWGILGEEKTIAPKVREVVVDWEKVEWKGDRTVRVLVKGGGEKELAV
ncbi:hypothetical protein BZA77DRAFT_328997 [Pyronema omphalodes]|nr:hypothetical protein BZA77DRAFT_328997 [Pyronema omphalodes]